MLFQILGPLRMADDRGEVVLGGLNRRAVLGYLLLYPNQVVSTSRLLTALWGNGRPASARKILHNSVSGLRKALSAAAEDRSQPAVSLVTREPGYQLTVDEQQIDLWQFKSLVQRARTVQADNCVDEASTLLREALALWRGPALADLAEAGFQWPELAAAENTRLDALEDFFAAELARGRHESVLTELQELTSAEPMRERLLGQFMLALHRCGRQAEALSMYEKAEATLEQTFGIEPGRELKELYRSIRANDPLLLTGRPGVAEAVAQTTSSAAVAEAPVEPESPGQIVAERRRVSVLQVRVDPSTDCCVDPEHLDDALANVDDLIRPQAERFGGVVTVRLGSHWLIVFGAPRSHHDDARRAVLCALAIRSTIKEVFGETADRLRMVVATGLVLARFRPENDSPPSITGATVDACHSLLPFVHNNEIWVTDETRAASENTVAYERAQISSVAWAAVGVRPPPQSWPVPMIGHQRARDTLLSVVDRFLRQRTPEVVSVHGDPGMGKSRLIAEVEWLVASRTAGHQPVPVVHLPVVLDDAALADALCKCCEITGDDLPETANRKLHEFVKRTALTAVEAVWMISALQPLLHRTSPSGPVTRRADRMAAWWRMLERIATVRCIVLVVDDVEFADHRVLDFVGRITRSSSEASVLVVADARPAAVVRRPQWAETQRHATPVTLLPLPDSDMEVLLDHLFDAHGLIPKRIDPTQPDGGGLAWLSRALVVACHGNPAFAHDYVALIQQAVNSDPNGATPMEADGVLPPVMERMTAERVDRLPIATRSVLQDAAVAGPVVWGDAVAAAGRWAKDEVKPHLNELVRHGFLVRSAVDACSGDTRYEFRFPPDRHVVYSQLSLALRAAKRTNVIAWIDALPDCRMAELLADYRKEEERITAMAGCSMGDLVGREEPATNGDVPRDARRGQADAAVRYYVALTEMPAWFRARLRWVAGELKVLRSGRNTVSAAVQNMRD
ncbi:BTAD domain-containing putative transcriptional regulator [Kibdelosporangium aridum]|uniref:DNA-binding transcriptional activator of the SARP family n=1 Tax=Kibdelosporangium aridum TaxID=2030 RepID=A0A1W2FXE2_KIBAR|nr:BTAD domain-containing putative transcriptional regulator [Kibdelosporangium aridum]SMD26533.1 DNA-binding transcriptional activator of the SARP family [Kibdelosporangium aridum]